MGHEFKITWIRISIRLMIRLEMNGKVWYQAMNFMKHQSCL